MTVFVGEVASPRSVQELLATRGLTSPSSNSFDLPVMTKSSAITDEFEDVDYSHQTSNELLLGTFPSELAPAHPTQSGERWRNYAALWSSVRRFVEDVFIHVPGFQPLSENGSVHRDVGPKSQS